MDEVALSEYGRLSSEPSPVARMMAAFAADFRDDVDINLGVGYVNEGTIPEELIAEGTGEVLAHPERYRQPLNYGGPGGSAPLVAALRDYWARHQVGGLTEGELRKLRILIAPVGATSLLDGLTQVLPKGIVVTADPMYYIYTNVLQRRGMELLTVPEDADGIRVDLLEDALEALGERRGEISFLYVVTVNNPSCRVLSNDRKAALVEAASRLSRGLGRKVPLVLDRAYEELIHGESREKPISGLKMDSEAEVCEISSLSKVVAPGLRMGYMMARAGALVRAMTQRTSDVGFSAPPINQAVAAWLTEHHLAEQVERVRAGYRERGRRCRNAIREHLGDCLADVSGGDASFYYYLTFRDVETFEGSAVFRFLSRTTGNPAVDGPPDARNPRVVYIPGEYCVNPNGSMVEAGRRQMRINYGFEEIGRIERAIALVAEAVRYARGK